MFKPSPLPLRDLKSWTSHTLHPSGSVIIDSGAHHVLSRRESGGRLLPAGVLGVRGAFASGQAVRIVVRRTAPGAPPAAEDAERAYTDGTETAPTTPLLLASASVTSSVTTLLDFGLADSLEKLAEADMTPSATMKSLPEDVYPVETPVDVTAEWELEEVGRGLANYNSAQIERVKGLKRYDAMCFCSLARL